MSIGIIAAMTSELETIINNIENLKTTSICNITFYEGKMYDKEVVAVMSGIGKVNASITTSLLINNFKPELIINTGIAGGSFPLETNEVIIASKLAYSDADCRVFGYRFGQIPQMPLYFEPDEEYKEKLIELLKAMNINHNTSLVLTADSFRLSKKEILNEVDVPFAVEMEGAAIAHTCHKLNTKFLSIRIISDILDSDNHIENYNTFEIEAAHLSSQITMNFIKKI